MHMSFGCLLFERLTKEKKTLQTLYIQNIALTTGLLLQNAEKSKA